MSLSTRGMLTAALMTVSVAPVHAFTFDRGVIKGSFDSTVTAGVGVRAQNQSCARIGDPSRCGGHVDIAGWSNGDDGNLNYNKGDLFTGYLKGTGELLLKLPDDYRLMARATWLYDAAAKNTARTPLSGDARGQIVHDVRLLDLWLSKEFTLGGERARWRLGNQVVNWGESLFGLGGINATNGYDLQRLSTPGTQLKEAVIPAPMLSFAAGLGGGVNVEAYYQFGWNRSRFAPVGGYFSLADSIGKGRQPLYLDNFNFNVGGLEPSAAHSVRQEAGFPLPFEQDVKAKHQGQYGLSLRYRPSFLDADLGLYVLNYHDKTPVLQYTHGGLMGQWKFLEDRKLYGASANFAVGNWAIGTELSYRPKDAVSLSPCYNPGGPTDANTNAAPASVCESWVDKKRFQLHLTGLLSLTPSDHKQVLDLLGADTATFLGEVVATKFPGLDSGAQVVRSAPDGTPVMQVPAAGYYFWTQNDPALGQITASAGTASSWGYTMDFSWTYDGKLIPGWQVTPGMTFFHAVKGRTPTLMANYMEGAKSANLYVLFAKNPATWQAGINFAKYFGGKSSFDQPYGDRSYFGAFVSRNF